MKTKLTWYGHATLGLETGGYSLLVDPFFTGNPAASATEEEMNPDFILVTHGHGDHIQDVVAIAKRSGALVVTLNEVGLWLGNQGVETHRQHIGGGYKHPFGYLKLTQATHGSGLPDGSYGGNPTGLLLYTNDGHKIYMAGDTGLFGDMRLIGEAGIDLAVLPIGDNFTMGPDDALRAVKFIKPAHVVPIHYNTWDLIKQDPYDWAQRVEMETDARPHVLNPGDSLSI
jgi:L-ascorbate metabolism protein UlaG (beta-lactamase superfamily)